jgi:hypothetical protein
LADTSSFSIAIDASAVAVLFDSIGHAKNIRRNHRDLASRLDHARAADQALTGRRRQQVELVFRCQRRLAARGGRRNRGRVVDQEGGDAAVKEAMLLQQLRAAID